mmetsp:Transcript_25717/g.64816  ORF Transcript_25717/g.64816 Transcript_25717/m.64816 type:complete len:361 (+) Transcript_25717:1206-2288(+)
MAKYVHRDAVYDSSMSSLLTPVSLIEYGLRREAFGEGMLAITDEGVLTAGAAQKYPARQKAFLDYRKSLPSLQERLRQIAPPHEPQNPPLTPSAAPLYPPSRWKDSQIPGNIGVSHSRKGENYSLHGNLGTGNPYSSYVFKAGDREETVFSDTLINRAEKRVTNEERKILRMQLAYALRRVKHLTSQQRVRQYQGILEKYFIYHFHMNRSLKTEFFAAEEFAQALCMEVVDECLVKKTALADKLFARKKANSVQSIPELEELFKEKRTLSEVETKIKNLRNADLREKLTDAGQLTRGRLDYYRWDFDNAISMDPPTMEMKPDFLEGFQSGRQALIDDISSSLRTGRESRSKSLSTRPTNK